VRSAESASPSVSAPSASSAVPLHHNGPVLFLAVLLVGLAQTYQNPVYGKDFPDPFVIEHWGKFYAYATGFRCLESDDLVHWTEKGKVLTVPWSKGHYWAPEVVERDGEFCMTYSAKNPETGK
jgi:beta-xylosidase